MGKKSIVAAVRARILSEYGRVNTAGNGQLEPPQGRARWAISRWVTAKKCVCLVQDSTLEKPDNARLVLTALGIPLWVEHLTVLLHVTQ